MFFKKQGRFFSFFMFDAGVSPSNLTPNLKISYMVRCQLCCTDAPPAELVKTDSCQNPVPELLRPSVGERPMLPWVSSLLRHEIYPR